MNKTLIFRKIGGIISEITEQYQYLAENPENINPLELELFIANSHFLSEHLAILKKLGDHVQVLEDQVHGNSIPEKRPLFVEPAILHSELNDESAIEWPHNSDESPETNDAETMTPEISEQQPVQAADLFHDVTSIESAPEKEVEEEPEIIPEIVVKETFSRPDQIQHLDTHREIIPEITAVKVEKQVITKPLVEEKVPTLNELLSAGKSSGNIADKISFNEVKDLKSMIKLNDKLMFIRDLFGGYSLAYSEAIDLVNRCETFEAADSFLKQNYALKNKWSDKQSTVDQFYEVLNRRFS